MMHLCVHACYGMCIEVRGRFVDLVPFPLWLLEIEFRSSELYTKLLLTAISLAHTFSLISKVFKNYIYLLGRE